MQLAECKMSWKKWCTLPLFSHVQCGHCVSCNWHPLPTLLGPPAPGHTFVHGTAHPLPSPPPPPPSLLWNNWLWCWQLSQAMPPSHSSGGGFRRGACHGRGLAHKSQPRPALTIQKQHGSLIALQALEAHRLLPSSYTNNIISLFLHLCFACSIIFF